MATRRRRAYAPRAREEGLLEAPREAAKIHHLASHPFTIALNSGLPIYTYLSASSTEITKSYIDHQMVDAQPLDKQTTAQLFDGGGEDG